MNITLRTTCRVALVVALAVAGCEPESGQTPSPVVPDPSPTVDANGHHSEGPHQGTLIELGNEEYHAELVHDEDAGTVTVYILDGAATKAVAIESKDVVINLKQDGKPRQFKLAAHPDADDPDGKASRFVSDDQELAENLDKEKANARLNLTIAGKGYTGTIEHKHEE